MTQIDRDMVRQMILEILQNMDLSQLVNLTTTPEPETEKKGRILALFTAGILGAKESCDALKALEDGGWTVDTVCTPNAQKLFYPHEATLPEIPGQPLDWEQSSPVQVMDQTDVIVLGVLTTSTAAKIATGIADNAVTEIIRRGLLQGKRIVAVYDACDMSHPYYKNAAPGYAKLVERNVAALREFGIELVHANELVELLDGPRAKKQEPVVVTVSPVTQAAPAPVVQVEPVVADIPENQADSEELYIRGILDAQTIRATGARKIRLARGTLVTPLARDLVKQRKIELVNE